MMFKDPEKDFTSFSSSDPDVIMHPAHPSHNDSPGTTGGVDVGGKAGPETSNPDTASGIPEPVKAKAPSLDLLDRIPKLYRLLDLRNDDGSGGIVDKVVIDQDSIARFANTVRPGCYRSTTQVDFRSLDQATIKPLGVYGSIPAIIKLWDELDLIGPETRMLLTATRNEHSGVSVPTLRPGIYLLDLTDIEANLYHIVFWPEDTTWEDKSTSSSVYRNRVTFMRYMTKLSDQLVCLISDEHSANLVWKDDPQYATEDEGDDEQESFEAHHRLFTFSVQKTNEETESAVTKEGFLLPDTSISETVMAPPGFPTDMSPAILDSRLVVGETSQAILQVDFVPEMSIKKAFKEKIWPMLLENRLNANTSPTIILADKLDTQSLCILLDHGLWARCGGDLKSSWNAQMSVDENKRSEDKKVERAQKLNQIAKDITMLQRSLPAYLVSAAVKLYPILLTYKTELLSSVLGTVESLPEEDEVSVECEVTSWLKQNSATVESKKQQIEADFRILTTLNGKDPYVKLKRRLRRIHYIIKNTPDLKDEEVKRLVDLINLEPGFPDKVLKVMNEPEGQGSRGVLDVIKDVITHRIAWLKSTGPTKLLPELCPMDDADFAVFLDSLVATNPAFNKVAVELKKHMVDHLSSKIKDLRNLPHEIGKALQDAMDQDLDRRYHCRLQEESDRAWKTLKARVQDILRLETRRSGSVLIIESILEERGYGYEKAYQWQGVLSTLEPAGLRYTLHPLEVKEDDRKRSASDKAFVSQPIIRQSHSQTFTLALDAKLRFMRLVGRDSCLVLLQTDRYLQVYLDRINTLSSVMAAQRHKKQIHIEKIGPKCVFALDETKRLFALVFCDLRSIKIHVFIYDVEMKAFNARGAAINITRWYPVVPTFSQLVFVAGTEELLLVQDTGSCRIFSLVTENFRPSTLDISEPISAAFSSSDGTCLFLETGLNEATRILCFHWASFGSNQGIVLDRPQSIPANSRLAVSSIGNRDTTHLLFLDLQNNICRSLLVQITSKSSDFTIHSDANGFSTGLKSESINNSLIDCHAEVWTKFPVYGGAVKRETSKMARHQARFILFVSSASPSKFSPYFTSLIRDFETKTRKPTKGLLKQIKISASQECPPDFMQGKIAVSELPLGEWLVGMFCLIPIHLAITNSNRFNPLKDGMSSPEFERQLLGANVIQIAQALSFGWYESIFSSYLAKKPVKVVTSMGEQSVGKSFALNHFVDTSFAGSAMRCTEGVWLSVTPTREYVIVAMDFEGVHSIERSAQEDTLLVLLNAAVSNFVLFRNNFALSRDIAGLFTSFQSSTNVLDTASNDNLFNGTLGIIIKDVIDSDTKEIVEEFHQKFQQIVRREKDDNFISKLHKGKFDIIPWPVIESAGFYGLFGALKKQLDRQPVTHKHAGAFIGDLKMLMAKLKANDWGALDLNLAVQRAEQLSLSLVFALAFGTADPSIGEPLRNFDTDEVIPGNPHQAVFYLESAVNATEDASTALSRLRDLRKSFPEYYSRFEMEEDEFFRRLTSHLQLLVTTRIEQVNQWLTVNTERFRGKAEVIALFRRFESLSKELSAGVALCGSKCTSCGLLCVELKLHDGIHDCKTAHKCHQICSFDDPHVLTTFPPCAMPAGHSGRHICSETPHLCGLPCYLHLKAGCLKACSKPIDHEEDEMHTCAANVHACGEPCSLVRPNGIAICERTCVIDCHREHDKHACDRSMSCPMKCQLCSSFCAAGDHFHALEEGAVHLCGQVHACRRLCEQPGICEIATTPQSIESTFVGKHDTYQYTRYTQEAKRLHCVIPIEADQLEHGGSHRHSIDPKAFHHCEERCKECSYYCTLPLNHPQNQHETSHGSMSETKWVVEGDEDATLELQGRKYATGDSGAPMLCSMICKTLGRHAHIDGCRRGEDGKCIGGAGVEHRRVDARGNTDWITHRLFWARSGFRDPYTNTEQADFDLCDHRCGGEEHDDVNSGAVPSYCVLPMFHPPADETSAPALGHASLDGHAYNCKNPALMQRSFHIFFALDRSGSMAGTDRHPLPNSPATQRIVRRANNRFGAVVSSLHGFWTARDAALRSTAAGMRRDAYTIIPFDSTASTLLANNTASNPDQLVDAVLRQNGGYGGTNFTHALQTVQREMERTWVTERSPVVVFLSDGECQVADSVVYDLCRKAVTLGKPLSLHSVSFGTDTYSHSLRRMAAIASEIYLSAPRDPLAPAGNPCSFSSAMDTIQLANTFMSIAASLKNPRAALSRV